MPFLFFYYNLGSYYSIFFLLTFSTSAPQGGERSGRHSISIRPCVFLSSTRDLLPLPPFPSLTISTSGISGSTVLFLPFSHVNRRMEKRGEGKKPFSLFLTRGLSKAREGGFLTGRGVKGRGGRFKRDRDVKCHVQDSTILIFCFCFAVLFCFCKTRHLYGEGDYQTEKTSMYLVDQ